MRATLSIVVLVSLALMLLAGPVECKKGHPNEKKHGEKKNGTLRVALTKHHSSPLPSHPPSVSAAATGVRVNEINSTMLYLSSLLPLPRSRSSAYSRTLTIDSAHFHSVSNHTHRHAHRHAVNATPSQSQYTVSLTDSYHVMYTAQLTIGSPPQSFSMILDTGSSCLWAISALLPVRPRYLRYYDHSASDSYSENGEQWAIQYGLGECAGFLSNDVVQLGSLTARNQTFAEATQLSGNFLNPNQPLDGILGLAFAGGACKDFPTFLDNLYHQQQIERRIFSFHFERKESDQASNEVIFGSPDSQFYRGELVWTDVLHAPNRAPAMWFVRLDSMTIKFRTESESKIEPVNVTITHTHKHGNDSDRPQRQTHRQISQKLKEMMKRHNRNSDIDSDSDSEELLPEFPPSSDAVVRFCGPETGPCIALPDTGTSFLTLPTRLFIVLVSLITHQRDDCVIDSQANVFCVDAPLGLPTLAFQFNDQYFTIKPADYVLPNKQLAIQVLDFGMNDLNIIILGDVFLRNVYTVFDADQWRVGFGRINDSNSDSDSDSGFGFGSESVVPVGRVQLLTLLAIVLLFLSCACCLCFCTIQGCLSFVRKRDYQPIPSAA